MTAWVISDLHFNHTQKMMEYCGRPADYEQRLFESLMALPEEDVLINLGDICMGKDEAMHERYIRPLRCKTWLVKGNHDKKSNSWYLDHGWDFVAKEIRDKYFGQKVVFTHIPIATDQWWQLNIHGHFHNTTHRSQEPNIQALYTDRHILIAAEHLEYKPKPVQQVIEEYAEKMRKPTTDAILPS